MLCGVVKTEIMVCLPVPTSWPAWKREAALYGIICPTSTPDLDNLLKSTFDALNNIVWVDDAQIIKTNAEKIYGVNPGIEIIAQRVPGKIPSQVATKKEFDRLYSAIAHEVMTNE